MKKCSVERYLLENLECTKEDAKAVMVNLADVLDIIKDWRKYEKNYKD